MLKVFASVRHTRAALKKSPAVIPAVNTPQIHRFSTLHSGERAGVKGKRMTPFHPHISWKAINMVMGQE